MELYELRKKLLTFSLILFSTIISLSQNVIISQYIETNSGTTPKGIEIYNVSGVDIDFSITNLVIYQGTNGAACSSLITISSGTLAAGEVWVIGTSDLTTYATTNGTNLSGTTDYNFSFNGDDALQVYLGGSLEDEFGTCGSDPGSAWTGGGVSTANQNISLLDGICTSSGSWTDPSTVFSTISTDPVNDMSGFGNSPTGCSCNISTSGVASISCNDNGTTPNAADDYITFDLDPTGSTLGATYNVSVSSGSISPTSASYGSATTFTLQAGSAGGGDVTVTITDIDDAGCTFDQVITDPGSCSVCDITASGLTNLLCNNDGTIPDGTDDYLTFDLDPTGLNLGATYTVSVNSGSISPTSASYGSATTFTLQAGSAGGGDVTVTITDVSGGACTLDQVITDPGTCSDPTCPDLYISEYIEGTSNNKCLEIYNNTGSTVDLSAENYQILIYANGGILPTLTVNLTGTVANGDVYVVCHGSSDPAFLAVTDQTAGLNFNGNDAVALSHNNVNIDIIGEIGFDPVTEWGTGATSTSDNTLVRNCSLFCPSDADGGNTFSPSSEWVGYATDFADSLGGVNCPPACVSPTSSATDISFANITNNSFDISWSGGDGTNSLVVISTSPVSSVPSNFTSYSSSTNFGSGDDIGTAEYVVYNGTGSSVSVTGLSSATDYYITIFEFNNTDPCYLSTSTETGTQTTSTTATELTFGTINATCIDINDNFSFTVCGTDASANVDFSFTGDITLAINTQPGGASLSGTLTQTAVSGCATFHNLNLDVIGSYSLLATSPGLSDGISSSFDIIDDCDKCATVTGALIDACGGSEGRDELFTFTTGNESVYVDSIVIDFPNNLLADYCNNGCGSNTLGENSAFIDDLNTTAGCVLFVYSDTIPPNSSVMVFTGNPPTTVYDFSGACSAAPIYAIFANNPTEDQGRFTNSGSGTRTLSVSFSSECGTVIDYVRDSLIKVDGAGIKLDPVTGEYEYYVEPDCTPINLILSNKELALQGKKINENNVELMWIAKGVEGEGVYMVQKSGDGVRFETFKTLEIGSNVYNEFKLRDANFNQPKVYYRVFWKGITETFYSNVISFTEEKLNFKVYPNPSEGVFNVKLDNSEIDDVSLSLYDLFGKEIKIKSENLSSDRMIQIDTKDTPNGSYLLKIFKEDNTYYKKLTIK